MMLTTMWRSRAGPAQISPWARSLNRQVSGSPRGLAPGLLIKRRPVLMARTGGASLWRARKDAAGRTAWRSHSSAAGAAERELIYEGPFGPVLRTLKRVSVFSCGCTLFGVPLLSYFGNEEMDPVQRGAVCFTVCAFAVGTTAALNFICRPYIWRVYRLPMTFPAKSAATPSSGATSPAVAAGAAAAPALYSAPLLVESFNLFGNIKTLELPHGLDDIYACKERIFVNCGIKDSDAMYLHEEGDCYADEDLYLQVMKRMGLKPQPQQSQ